jgi:hypothetical protein
MNVCDAIIEELRRQGADVMAGRDFRVTDLAVAVIKAADGDLVRFPENEPRG